MDEEPEKPPRESVPILSDPTLFNNFWLNEIKSLDDTSRILLSATILILSAYFTIIAANFEKMTASLNIASFDLITILAIPFFSWLLCLLMLSSMHVGPMLDSVQLLDINSSKGYIVSIYKCKYFCLLASYMLLFLPIIYLAASIAAIYSKRTDLNSDLNYSAGLFTFIIGAIYSLDAIELSRLKSKISTEKPWYHKMWHYLSRRFRTK